MAVYRPRPDGGYTSPKPVVKAKAPIPAKRKAVVKAAPPPTVFWFQGRPYYSQKAYQAAVAASKMKAAASRELSAKQAAERKRLSEAAAKRQAAEAARVGRYRAAVEAAVRAKAAEVRQRQLLERRAAEQAARAKAELTRRASERKALVASSKQVKQAEVTSPRLQAELRAGEARKKAYDWLQTQNKARLRAFGSGRPRALSGVDERTTSQLHPTLGRGDATVGAGDTARAVKKGETTGDWSDAMELLERQSVDSKGRYFDQALLDKVTEEYVNPVVAVGAQFSDAVDEFDRLEAADDLDGMLELINSAEFLALQAKFLEYYGDGREPGTFQRHMQILSDLATRREDLWTRQLFQMRQRSRLHAPDGEATDSYGEFQERVADTEYNTTVLDPDTGQQRRITLTGVDAWLERESVREYERMQRIYRQNQQAQRDWEVGQHRNLRLTGEGRTLESLGEGRFAIKDPLAESQRRIVEEWLPEWELNDEGVPRRIADAAANPAMQEQLIRAFLNDAAAAWGRHQPEGRGRYDPLGRDPRGNAPQRRQAWLDRLARSLGKPAWSSLDQISATGVGAITQGALTVFSAIPALARAGLQPASGGLEPDIAFPWEEGGGRFSFRRDESAEADEALLRSAYTGDFWADLGPRAEALRTYSQWGGGSVGGFLTQFVDPTVLLGPGNFIRPGAQAIARAGGARAVLSGGSSTLRTALADYVRFADTQIGVLGNRAVRASTRMELARLELARLELARKAGLDRSAVLDMSDADFRELASAAQRGTDDLLKNDWIAAQLERKGIDKTQLLNMVQGELPRIMREFKLGTTDPFKMMERISAVREAAERATLQAEAAEHLVKAQAERASALAALEAVGVAVPRRQVAPQAITRLQALEGAYQQSTREYLAAADRASSAAERLLAGGINPSEVRRLKRDLVAAERDVVRLGGETYINRWGRKKLREGEVGRYWERVANFRSSLDPLGKDPTGPSFADLSWAQLRQDALRVSAMTKQVQRDLARIPATSPLSAPLVARLKLLQRARRGLEYEIITLDRGRSLYKKVAEKHIDRIRPAVRPQRIAALATDSQMRKLEVSRDVHARLVGAREIRQLVRLNAREARSFEALRTAVGATKTQVTDAVQDFLDATKGAFDDASLFDHWVALRMATQSHEGLATWGAALRSVERQMVDAGRAAGLRGSPAELADRMWDVLRDDHARLGGRIDDFASAEQSVSAALRDWRKRRAQGQIRLRERRFRPQVEPSALLRADSDPVEVLVKMRALRDQGASVFEYDELRGVLGDLAVKERVEESLLRLAERRVARTGESLEEAFIAERAARAELEAKRNFEEFAVRPDNQGLPPAMVLRRFEEYIEADDLGASAGHQLSEFQRNALRQMFEAKAGFSFDDELLRRRWLQGARVTEKGTRFARSEELPPEFLSEFPDVPVYVVEDVKVADALMGAGNDAWAEGPRGIFVRPSVTAEDVWHEVLHVLEASNPDAMARLTSFLPRSGMSRLDWEKSLGRKMADESEIVAEIYGLSRAGTLDRVYRVLSEDARLAVDLFLGEAAAMRVPIRDAFGYGPHMPPLANRAKMRHWLVDHGFWSPRTGEQIASGQRVWSVDEEREFFERTFAYTPPWTDREVLRVVLNDQRLHQAAFAEWGFFDDSFEELVGGLDLEPKQLADALVWGKEGLQRQRTLTEIRDWASQRYGDIVVDDNGQFTAMPWLMHAGDEYSDWLRSATLWGDDTLTAAEQAARLAVRDRLPGTLQKALFEGDALSRVGLKLDPRIVKAKELDKLREAIASAAERRLGRMRKAGDIDPGDWLPQEQLRFAYDVTDSLLADPVWRGILRGTPIAGEILHAWGQLWRMLVSVSLAFPIMNLIEVAGLKRLYLTLQTGGLPLSLEREGRRLVQSLRQVGLESDSVFGLSGDAFARAADGGLGPLVRARSAAAGVVELPLTISKFGEDRLRLDFARRVAGNTYREAIRAGKQADVAEWLALQEAKRLGQSFFATTPKTGFVRGLNELVPFLSYNFNNKILAVREIVRHPALLAWGERIRREIEASNREAWAEEHPDLPFLEGPSASWLWWKVGDVTYKIDLSNFSDWTRAMSAVTSDQSAVEWFTEFVRVPHPSQLGLFATLTGGVTPWGKPGDWREMTPWADFFQWANGQDYSNPKWRRDLIQMVSKMLFFKEFGAITPMDVKVQTFFAIRQADPDAAREYLEANPDLDLYFKAVPDRGKIGFDPLGDVFWRQLMTEAENRQFDADNEAWDQLNDELDREVAQYGAAPWSEAYKAAKKRAAVRRRQFLLAHPELVRGWATLMSPEKFAALEDRAVVDDLTDAWFNWDRPKADAYESDLEYQRALVAWHERREEFLEAHPSLRRRLSEGHTAVETAWREQELHWSEILAFQARLKLRILEEEQRGDAADRDVIDLLYRVRDVAGAELDAERYAVFDNEVLGRRVGERITRFLGMLPGFADNRFAKATPEERKQIERDEWYANGIAAIVKRATDGKTFYDLLRQNPALLQEYWARNPDAKARYQAGQEYFRYISAWVTRLQASDFAGAQAVWDQMPAWVKERYFAKHPDSAMRDGMGGGGTAVQYKGKWFKSPESRDRYIMFVENGTAVEYNGKWFKSPESRDRYIRWIEGGGQGDSPEEFVEAVDGPQRFRSEESRQRFLRGQEYFAAISRWVELLKADDFVGADRYFRGLPGWMKEKYYDKHPDQRAKAELDSAALRYGAEYFLATGDDKLEILAKYPQLRAWLDENGGDEAAMRGLIMAMYRAIPSTEPWLKRTFRERFPEIFSAEAAGERKLRRIASTLADHPEMLPFYERALRLQTSLYTEQLKRSLQPPKPFEMQRKRRMAKRSKRRAARLHSRWTLHRDIRRYATVET